MYLLLLGCILWNGPFSTQSYWRKSDDLRPSKGTEGIVKVVVKLWWRFWKDSGIASCHGRWTGRMMVVAGSWWRWGECWWSSEWRQECQRQWWRWVMVTLMGMSPVGILAPVLRESWRALCTNKSLKWFCGHLPPSFTGRTGSGRCKLAW